MNEIYVIKDRLKQALEVRSMLPAELAKECGINKGCISRYLAGTVIPKPSAIQKMAEALEVSPTWLLGYSDGAPTPKLRIQSSPIDLTKLTKINKARLLAYYQALLDSQEDKV